MTGKARVKHATGYALLLLVLGLMVLQGREASAGTLIYEPFNYPPGSFLNGQNGGTGFSSPWIATSDYKIGAGSLPVPGLAGTGNHVVFTENNLAVSEATRSVLFSGFGNDGTTTWVSFVMQADTDPTTGVFEFSLPNFFIGKLGTSDPNLWGVSGGVKQFSAVPIQPGVPVFVVVKFQFNSDPNANDTATVYFNPTPGLGAPNVGGIVVSENFSSAIGNVFLDAGNGTAFSFDPLVFGDTYTDVAPGAPIGAVPEPGSMLLLGSGSLGLLGVLRRRLIS